MATGATTLEAQHLANEATAHLIQRYSPSGNRIGWMMTASIFIEAWDLYSISFLLVFLTAQFHPSALLLYVAVVSGLVGPQIVHRIGQRRLSQYGFAIVLISLLVAGFAIASNIQWLIPLAAAAVLWGHYWDAENVMTIPAMVAAPRYRGVATGFGYIHTKLPQFLGIFLFPAFFNAIGVANATFFTAIFPLVGLLAATFILREVYGYIEVKRSAQPATREMARPAAHAA